MRFWNSIFGNSDRSDNSAQNDSIDKGKSFGQIFSRTPKKKEALQSRKLHIEQFESRELLSIDGPQINSIFINQDESRALEDDSTLNIAPTSFLLRFTEGKSIDPASLTGIEVYRADGDGEFLDSKIKVDLGYIGVGDNPNEVILRFADVMPSDTYQIHIVGGDAENALRSYLVNPDYDPDNPDSGQYLYESFYNPDGNTDAAKDYLDANFVLNLGAKVTSVVTQPVSRTEDGSLKQSRNTVEVYFTDEKLLESAPGELDPRYFQLIATQNTLDPGDDFVVLPSSVKYEYQVVIDGKTVNRAILTFTENHDGQAISDIADLSTGSFRLRIGEMYFETETHVLDLINAEHRSDIPGEYPGDTFKTAYVVDSDRYFDTSRNNPQSLIIHGQINRQYDPSEYPGARDDPGHRDLPYDMGLDVENHYMGYTDPGAAVDLQDGTNYRYYNFKSDLGLNPKGGRFTNVITEAQKELTRMIFDMYSRYLGIQFIESDDLGITVATGDLAWLGGQSGGGVAGLGGGDSAIMDGAINWGASVYGGAWFDTALHEIGHCLGLGHSYDLMPGTDMGSGGDGNGHALVNEKTYPGIEDIIHGMHMYRPDSTDVDIHEFELRQNGTFSAEIFAQRENAASQLDASIKVYKKIVQELGDGSAFTTYELVAQNDDYFDNDSFLELYLTAGTYYIAVSASGNDEYNPQSDGTGEGGRTLGNYELRLNFDSYGVDRENSATFSHEETDYARSLVSVANRDGVGSGGKEYYVKFDGDADMVPGGAYDYWFNVQKNTDVTEIHRGDYDDEGDYRAALEGINRTLFVDNSTREYNADGSAKPIDPQKFRDPAVVGDGTLDNPFKTIEIALERAADLQKQLEAAGYKDHSVIVRIVGNGFEGDDYDTSDSGNRTLRDNKAYEVGVNFQNNNATLADGAKFDVPKGVSVVIDAGVVIKLGGVNITVGSSDATIDRSGGSLQLLGTPVHRVLLTSYFDETIGVDTFPLTTQVNPGDWGGIVMRNDYDYEYIEHYDPASNKNRREVLEKQGIFINTVNNADIRYGGGSINNVVFDAIHVVDARPMLTFNTITFSHNAAISATPHSFEETRFQNWDHYDPITTGYTRVGLHVHGNTVVNNTINGLLVHTNTPVATADTDKVKRAVRFDDADIVHVLMENLIVSGQVGGNVLTKATASSLDFGYGYLGDDLTNRDTDTYKDQMLTVAYRPQDGEYFSLTDGETKVTFEFNLVDVTGQNINNANRVQYGRIAIDILSSDTPTVVAGKIADAIAAVNANSEAYDTLNSRQYPKYLIANQRLTDNQFKITADFENSRYLKLVGTGQRIDIDGIGLIRSRASGSVVVDPGLVFKSHLSRIELEMGTLLLAEGTANQPIVFTSLYDTRHGAGGVFTTHAKESSTENRANPGDWAGIDMFPNSVMSLDHVVFAYAGGSSYITGNLAQFNPIEIREADARIVNSRFEYNTGSRTGFNETDRSGRSWITPAVIFVRGAQPIIVNNQFLSNRNDITDHEHSLAIISINANSLNDSVGIDHGSSTGAFDRYAQYDENMGPLVRLNTYTDNSINGMIVRGEVLTTESVWDDADVAHVLFSEIVIPNFHTTGGLRLMSEMGSSLVVKLLGTASAGFTTSGTPLEIDDRIGGAMQVVGVPGYPVIFTSLKDDSVGAGFDLRGQVMYDTNNTASKSADGTWVDPSIASAADWRSIKFDNYSHDRNVLVIKEFEKGTDSADSNSLPGADGNAQHLGYLAPDSKSGDETQRLGFEVHGSVRANDPTESDIYSFTAQAGTEIWVDIDFTGRFFDSIVEIIDADGNVLASSDNSFYEGPDREGRYINRVYDYAYDPKASGDHGTTGGFTGGRYAFPLNEDSWTRVSIAAGARNDEYDGVGYNDKYSTNTRDAGFRYVTEGPGEKTYYVRVRSNLSVSWANGIWNRGYRDTDGDVSDGLVASEITRSAYHGKEISIEDTRGESVTYRFDFDAQGIRVDDASPNTLIIGMAGVDVPDYVAYIIEAVNEHSHLANRNLHAWAEFDESTTISYETVLPGVFFEGIYDENGLFTREGIDTGRISRETHDGTSFSVRDNLGEEVHYRYNFERSDIRILTDSIDGKSVSVIEIGMNNNVGITDDSLFYAYQLDSAFYWDTYTANPDLLFNYSVDFNPETNGYVFQPGCYHLGYYEGDTFVTDAIDAYSLVASQDHGREFRVAGPDGSVTFRYNFESSDTFVGENGIVEIGLMDARLADYGSVISQAVITYAASEMSVYDFGTRETVVDDPRIVLGHWAGGISPGLSHGTSFTIQNTKEVTATTQKVRYTLDFETDRSTANSSTRSVTIGLKGVAPSDYATTIRDAINELTSVANRNLHVNIKLSRNGLNDTNPVMLVEGGVFFNPEDSGLVVQENSSGYYQLQLRLQETDEVPGSSVSYADIRYATNGIEAYGFPQHSPLLGEIQLSSGHTTFDAAQRIGNLLQADRNTLSVAGYLSSLGDVNWYSFDMEYAGIQNIAGVTNGGALWSTIFDIDYADGMGRPDLSMWVFNSAGALIYMGTDSNVADDQPGALPEGSIEKLSAGSVGSNDPFIGPALLQSGMPGDSSHVYYVAVTSKYNVPDAIGSYFNPSNPQTRIEPVDTLTRVAEEHVNGGQNMGNGAVEVADRLTLSPDELYLNDVVAYATNGGTVYMVNMATGEVQTSTANINPAYGDDLALWYDGRLISTRTAGSSFTIYELDKATLGGSSTGTDSMIYPYYLYNNQATRPGGGGFGANAMTTSNPGDYYDPVNDVNGRGREAYTVVIGDMDGAPVSTSAPADLNMRIEVWVFDDDDNPDTPPVYTSEKLADLNNWSTRTVTQEEASLGFWTPNIPTALAGFAPEVIRNSELRMYYHLIDENATYQENNYLSAFPQVKLVPSRPGLTATSGGNSPDVNFTWDASQYARGYLFEVIDPANGRVVHSVELTGTNYVLRPDGQTVRYGTSYIFRLTALNLTNKNLPTGERGQSAVEMRFSTGPNYATFPAAVLQDTEWMALTWNAVENPTGFTEYEVVRSYTDSETGDVVEESLGRVFNDTTFTDKTRDAGVDYEYEVRAYDVNSLPLDNAEITDELRQSGFYTLVTWDSLEGVSDYRIQRQPDGAGDAWETIDNVSLEGAAARRVQYRDYTVAGNNQYNYRVVSVTTDADGNEVLTPVPDAAGSVTVPMAYTSIDWPADADWEYGVEVNGQVPWKLGLTGGPYTAGWSYTNPPAEYQTANNSSNYARDNNGNLVRLRGIATSQGGLGNRNILYLLRTDGLVWNPVDAPLGTARIFSNAIPFAQFKPIYDANRMLLIGGGGSQGGLLQEGEMITGTAFDRDNVLYVVTDIGAIYKVSSHKTRGYYPIPAVTGNPGYPPSIGGNGSGGAQLEFLGFALDDAGNALEFSGLTIGPANVENGSYRDTFFGTTSSGQIFTFQMEDIVNPFQVQTGTNGARTINPDLVAALDTELRQYAPGNITGDPVAVNPFRRSVLSAQLLGGQSVVSSGINGLDGVTFSSFDYNLWHWTNNDADPIYNTPGTIRAGGWGEDFGDADGRETYGNDGGQSWYFGVEDTRAAGNPHGHETQPLGNGTMSSLGSNHTSPDIFNTYNVPGGTYGSLSSNAFSLRDYTPEDLPMLYFSYKLDADGDGEDVDDVLAVYVSTDDHVWERVASNAYELGDGWRTYDSDAQDHPSLVSDDQWRQARIDLSRYAGQDNVKLKFVFSTAGGQIGLGNQTRNGTAIQSVPAHRVLDNRNGAIVNGRVMPDGSLSLSDQGYTVGGVDFRFSQGYSLYVPSAPGGQGRATLDQSFTIEGREFVLRNMIQEHLNRWGSDTLVEDYFSRMNPEEMMRIIIDAVDYAELFGENGQKITARRYTENGGAYSASNPYVGQQLYFENATSLRTNATGFVVTGGAQDTTLEDLYAMTPEGMLSQLNHWYDFQQSTSRGAVPVPIRGDMTETQLAASVAFMTNLVFDESFRTHLRSLEPGLVGGGGIALVNYFRIGGKIDADFNTDIDGDGDVDGTDRAEEAARRLGEDPRELLDLFATYNDMTIEKTLRLDHTRNVTESGGAAANIGDGVEGRLNHFTGQMTLVGKTISGAYEGRPTLNSTVGKAGPFNAYFRELEGSVTSDREIPNTYNWASLYSKLPDGRLAQAVNNTTKGFHLDNIIIGLAERGETVTHAPEGVTTFTQIPAYQIPGAVFGSSWPEGSEPVLQGAYQLEIRRASENVYYDSGINNADPISLFNSNERLTEGITMVTPLPSELYHGQKFSLTDGVRQVEFVFLVDDLLGGAGDAVQIKYSQYDTVTSLTTKIITAINQAFADERFAVNASSNSVPGLIDLFHAVDFKNGGLLPFVPEAESGTPEYDAEYREWLFRNGENGRPIKHIIYGMRYFEPVFVYRGDSGLYPMNQVSSDRSFEDFISRSNTSTSRLYLDQIWLMGDRRGDTNLVREQGQLNIFASTIMYSSEYGIRLEPAPRGATGQTFPGGVMNMQNAVITRNDGTKETRQQGPNLVPGVSVSNNIIAYSGIGGIHLAGDSGSADGADAAGAVPFVRIVNNTFYGSTTGQLGIGIEIGAHASPTIMNNIFANLASGISIDATSGSTVALINAYQNNAANIVNGSTTSADRVLAATDPLFVDPEVGNFYLEFGSLGIDAGAANLLERTDWYDAYVRELGIPRSTIYAPEKDIYGQLRVADEASGSGGTGSTAFVDLGAVDRVDNVRPTSGILVPNDNDSSDRNSEPYDVFLVDQFLNRFVIQLSDIGIGIDDLSVANNRGEVYENIATILEEVWNNDTNKLEIKKLVLNEDYFATYNSSNDQMYLTPTRGRWRSNATYTILLDNDSLQNWDMTFPTEANLQQAFPNGEPLQLWINGTLVTVSTEDLGDQSAQTLAQRIVDTVNIDPTAPTDPEEPGETEIGYIPDSNGGFVSAEVIYDDEGKVLGVRFHDAPYLQSDGSDFVITSTMTGQADDEDGIRDSAGNALNWNRADGQAKFVVVFSGYDYGDAGYVRYNGANVSYPTTLDNPAGSARHTVWTGYSLGNGVTVETDGQPNQHAIGSDGVQVHGDRYDDGVTLQGDLVPGKYVEISIGITAKNSAFSPDANGHVGYVNAFFDWDRDGVWKDESERMGWLDGNGNLSYEPLPVTAGTNKVFIFVPESIGGKTLDDGDVFARFRFSTTEKLGPTGTAPDGEVEDYKFYVARFPRSYGDAPEGTYLDPNTGQTVTYQYPTLKGSNGAWHATDIKYTYGPDGTTPIKVDSYTPVDEMDATTQAQAIHFGTRAPLSSSDAYPSVGATGSATDDGLDFSDPNRTLFVGGQTTEFDVTINLPDALLDYLRANDDENVYLSAWFDIAGKGSWNNTTDRMIDEVWSFETIQDMLDGGDLVRVLDGRGNGTSSYIWKASVTLPEAVADGQGKWNISQGISYARFRVATTEIASFDGPLGEDGIAYDGEVEDHAYYQTPFGEDRGDAPASYGEATHRIVTGVYLGEGMTADFQSRYSPGADADELDDGVILEQFGIPGTDITYSNVFRSGGTTIIEVYASTPGYLSVWIDADNSGLFDEDERYSPLSGYELREGRNLVEVELPELFLDETLETFARFRFTDLSVDHSTLDATGFAANGEVEDTTVEIIGSTSEISGTVFNDADADGYLGYTVNGYEEGVPGVTMYLVDSRGLVIDTAETDRFGEYRFQGVFPGVYSVVQSPITTPKEWISTNPGVNADGMIVQTLAIGNHDFVQYLNFGNFLPGTVNLGDAVVVEGNSGSTLVRVPVYLSDSFGSPIKVTLKTSDGTAIAGQDYIATDASGYTFPTGSDASSTWDIRRLKSGYGETGQYDNSVSGKTMAYAAQLGNVWQVMLHSEADPTGVFTLTNSTYDSIEPQVLEVGDELHVVWSTFNGKTYDLYYTRGRNDNLASLQENIVKLGNPAVVSADVDNLSPRISADVSGNVFVSWLAKDATGRSRVLWQNASTGNIENGVPGNTVVSPEGILNNTPYSGNVTELQCDGSSVMWIADNATVYLSAIDPVTGSRVTKMVSEFAGTQGSKTTGLRISGGIAVWEQERGSGASLVREVCVYNVDAGASMILVPPSGTFYSAPDANERRVVWQAETRRESVDGSGTVSDFQIGSFDIGDILWDTGREHIRYYVDYDASYNQYVPSEYLTPIFVSNPDHLDNEYLWENVGGEEDEDEEDPLCSITFSDGLDNEGNFVSAAELFRTFMNSSRSQWRIQVPQTADLDEALPEMEDLGIQVNGTLVTVPTTRVTGVNEAGEEVRELLNDSDLADRIVELINAAAVPGDDGTTVVASKGNIGFTYYVFLENVNEVESNVEDFEVSGTSYGTNVREIIINGSITEAMDLSHAGVENIEIHGDVEAPISITSPMQDDDEFGYPVPGPLRFVTITGDIDAEVTITGEGIDTVVFGGDVHAVTKVNTYDLYDTVWQNALQEVVFLGTVDEGVFVNCIIDEEGRFLGENEVYQYMRTASVTVGPEALIEAPIHVGAEEILVQGRVLDGTMFIDDSYYGYNGRVGRVLVYGNDNFLDVTRLPEIFGDESIPVGIIETDLAFTVSDPYQSAMNTAPRLSGDRVVWRAALGTIVVGDYVYGETDKWSVLYNDLSDTDVVPSVVSQSEYSAWYPMISEDRVVWRSYVGTDYAVFSATMREAVLVGYVEIMVYGDPSLEGDEYFHVEIADVSLNSELGVELDLDQLIGEKSTGIVWILNDDGTMDFGDLPDSYATLLGSDGARHGVSARNPLALNDTRNKAGGIAVDTESNGRPDAAAAGDDHTSTTGKNDEQGVAFGYYDENGNFVASPWEPGKETTVTIEVTEDCILNAFVDWTFNGSFGEHSLDQNRSVTYDSLYDRARREMIDERLELLFDAENLVEDAQGNIIGYRLKKGVNEITFTVPQGVSTGSTYARFRVSSAGGLSFFGYASDGEVEDYRVEIARNIDDPVQYDEQTKTITISGSVLRDEIVIRRHDARYSDNLTVTYNGTVFRFDPENVEFINFDGVYGADTVSVYGSADDVEHVTMRPIDTNPEQVGTTILGTGLTIRLVNAPHVLFDGGVLTDEQIGAGTELAKDTVVMYDSYDNDTLIMSPNTATMRGTFYTNTVRNVYSVGAVSNFGFDSAVMNGSNDGTDIFRTIEGENGVVTEASLWNEKETYRLGVQYFADVQVYNYEAQPARIAAAARNFHNETEPEPYFDIPADVLNDRDSGTTSVKSVAIFASSPETGTEFVVESDGVGNERGAKTTLALSGVFDGVSGDAFPADGTYASYVSATRLGNADIDYLYGRKAVSRAVDSAYFEENVASELEDTIFDQLVFDHLGEGERADEADTVMGLALNLGFGNDWDM